MNRKKVLDLSNDLPSIDVIISSDRTLNVTVRDIYELAMINAGSGVPLKDRMDKITEEFNDRFDCDLSEDKMFILMMHGMEAIEEFVGNIAGSST